ncbi:MAG: hypothetical protein RIR60_477, partial [Pseudomonadota bacterium]
VQRKARIEVGVALVHVKSGNA